jgi:hypothetical protein
VDIYAEDLLLDRVGVGSRAVQVPSGGQEKYSFP